MCSFFMRFFRIFFVEDVFGVGIGYVEFLCSDFVIVSLSLMVAECQNELFQSQTRAQSHQT